jgi:N6-adenosine-specific RNA methylase IME4
MKWLDPAALRLHQTSLGRRGWPFAHLRPHGYQVIYADPAWRFATRSEKGKGKSPDAHYRTMTLEELAALPVRRLAARTCALICWIYDPMIPQALWLLEHWGFTFKTRLFDWPKETANGLDAFGQGYFTRNGGEQCWLATIGAPKCLDHGVRQYQRALLREHSRKPDLFPMLIERMFDGPYCELFSRTERDGWQSWGDETWKFPVPEIE